MNFEILVSTMFQENHSLVDKMNINSNAVIINQCNEDSEVTLNRQGYQIKWINTTDRGLSKSRNLALLSTTGDICLLADDDLIYREKVREVIIKEFKKYPEVDVIAFCVNGIEREFKKYSKKEKKINFLSAMKVSSVEMAFRSSSLKEKNIKFNELFGSGSYFYMGEESIFLFECLKKGLNVRYVPVMIADLHLFSSSWFEGYTDKYFQSKGAAFSAMSSSLGIFLSIQFLIRKLKIYHQEMSIIKGFKNMLQGRKEYLSLLKSIEEPKKNH